VKLAFRLNGVDALVEAPGDRRVVDLLREDLGLVGTKEPCGTGDCGGCTILVDGESRLSCLMVAAQLEGRDVTTIEGLPGGESNPLVRSFGEAGAVQCGYCTPGMVLSAVDLLRRSPSPSRDEIRTALSGNLCRCTGYAMIVDAVEAAAGRRGEEP